MKRPSHVFDLLLGGLVLLAACGKSNMNESFVTELDTHGYFTGLAPEKAQALKSDFRKQGWMAFFSDSHRFFHADAEDLAEGGICAFIRKVEPFLTAQGVRVPELQDEVTEKGYTVRVGGTPHLIYAAADLQRDSNGKEPGVIWGLAMTRGFRIVDQLLEVAGSPERLYAANGGNDLFAFFLTPELHQIVSQHPDADAKDGPYKPTEDYPWFGEPHE
jgi:hypothetical protein